MHGEDRASSLRRRWWIQTLQLILVALLVAGLAWPFTRQAGGSDASSDQQLTWIARNAATQLEENLRLQVRRIEQIVDMLQAADESSSEVLKEDLTSVLKATLEWQQLGLSDLDGEIEVLVSTVPSSSFAEASNVGHQRWFQQALTTGQPFLSSRLAASALRGDGIGLVLSAPVQQWKRPDPGVVFGVIAADAWLPFGAAATSAGEVRILVADAENGWWAPGAASDEPWPDDALAGLVGAARQVSVGNFDWACQGLWPGAEDGVQRCRAATLAVDPVDWQVVVLSSPLASRWEGGLLAWWVFGGAVLLLLAGSWWQAGTLSRELADGLASLPQRLAPSLASLDDPVDRVPSTGSESDGSAVADAVLENSALEVSAFGGVVPEALRSTSQGVVWSESEALVAELDRTFEHIRRRLAQQGQRLVSKNARLRELRHQVSDLQRQQRDLSSALAAKTRDTRLRPRRRWLTPNYQEIEAPLAALLERTEKLDETPSQEISKRQTTGLVESAHGLWQQFETLADFSRAEQGQIELDIVAFDPVEVLTAEVEVYRRRAEAKGLTLEVDVAHPEVADSQPKQLQGDPKRLRQVVAQMMSNAIKFTRRGGIGVTWVWRRGDAVGSLEDTSDANAQGPYNAPGLGRGFEDLDLGIFEYRISDSGIGISFEAQQGLLQAKSQHLDAVRQEYGGIGLGLPLCHHLVRLMGGQILVESSPGVGSSFVVRLPQQHPSALNPEPFTATSEDSNEDTPPQPAWQESPQKGPRILVAEDHEINREVILSQLHNLGYRVKAVENGLEALEALAVESFDLLLLDCQMPQLDGYETVRRLRRMTADVRSLPVIAVTAHAMEGERERCLAAGMDDYLAKPVRQAELAKTLDRWLIDAEPATQDAARVVSHSVASSVAEDLESQLGGGEAEGPSTDQGSAFFEGRFRDPGLDWDTLEQLHSLRRGSGQDLLGKVIRTLLRTFPERFETCDRLLQEGDFEALGLLAHGLKGSAGNSGASSLSMALDSVEKAAQADVGRQETLAAALSTARREFDRLVPVLKQLGGESSVGD